jgi:hypothetical protein
MLLHRAPFVLTFSSTMASHQICNMDLTPNPVQNRQLMLLCPQVDPARQHQYSWWTNNATSCCTAGRQLVRCWIISPREKHELTWPQKERHCSSSAPQCSVSWEEDTHSKKSIVAAAAAGVVSFDGLNVPVLDTNLGPKKKGEKVQMSCPRTCRSIDRQTIAVAHWIIRRKESSLSFCCDKIRANIPLLVSKCSRRPTSC